MLKNKHILEKEGKKYFSAPELAKLLGVSRTAIFKRIQSGQIHAEKVGRNYIIPREEYEKLKLKDEIADDALIQLKMSLEDLKHGRVSKF